MVREYLLVEELFLEADKLLYMQEYVKGKRLLEEILETEPGYGRAHNHLGWLYYAKFNEFKRARYHLELAVKFAPEYPAGYLNLTYVLNEVKDQATLNALRPKALAVPGIRKELLYNEYGRSCEMNMQYADAIAMYREAIKLAMDSGLTAMIEENLARAKTKKSIYRKRFLLW